MSPEVVSRAVKAYFEAIRAMDQYYYWQPITVGDFQTSETVKALSRLRKTLHKNS